VHVLYFWLNDNVNVWPGHCNPVISLSMSLCRSFITWMKSGGCWSTGSKLKGWIGYTGSIFVCGHVYRLLSETGVCNTLEPCMFDIREKNVVSDDHLHFTNYLQNYKISQTWVMTWNIHGWNKTNICHGHLWFMSMKLSFIETFPSKLPLKVRYRLF